jgi:DNA-binding CsgD family transcriptional regulator
VMDTQLHRQCLEVLHAKTVKDFVRISAAFGQSMGFHTMAAMVVQDHSPHLSEFQWVTNAPPDWMPTFEDADSARLDPVAQHCKLSSSPIVWDQKTYVTAGRPDFWEQQAPFGYQSGVGIGIHLPHGRHFALGFDSDERSCAPRKAMLGLTLDFAKFASYAQAAAFDLCLPYPRGPDEQTLAAGELDALRRSMDGLSDWEVGNAMSISETEVLLRLRRATTKLGCATRYEAALRAIRLGLVACT